MPTRPAQQLVACAAGATRLNVTSRGKSSELRSRRSSPDRAERIPELGKLNPDRIQLSPQIGPLSIGSVDHARRYQSGDFTSHRIPHASWRRNLSA
jgi:hypothetical protein